MALPPSSNKYLEHFQQGFADLTAVDSTRMHVILEIIEYAALNAMLGTIFGITIDRMFPLPDTAKSSKQIFIEIIAQAIVSAVVVFYIEKLVKLVPYIFEGISDKYPEIEKYSGAILVAITFVGTQGHLIKKLEILRERYD